MANIQMSGQTLAPTGPGTTDNIAATAYTVPAGRRLQITDIVGGTADVLGGVVYLQNVTAGTVLWQHFVPPAGTLHVQFATPVEVVAAVQVRLGIEGYTGGVGSQFIAGFSGRLES